MDIKLIIRKNISKSLSLVLYGRSFLVLRVLLLFNIGMFFALFLLFLLKNCLNKNNTIDLKLLLFFTFFSYFCGYLFAFRVIDKKFSVFESFKKSLENTVDFICNKIFTDKIEGLNRKVLSKIIAILVRYLIIRLIFLVNEKEKLLYQMGLSVTELIIDSLIDIMINLIKNTFK